MTCPKPQNILLSGPITIDCGKDDDGLLHVTRHWYTGCETHWTRQKALENCFVTGARRANIVGVGKPGRINTGSGDRDPGDDQFMGLKNRSDWEDELRAFQLRPGARLTLCSCDTGSKDAGADFLLAVADVLQGEVCAPTGLVFFDTMCKVLSLQKSAVWQVATPGNRPPSINPPKPYVSNFMKNVIFIAYERGLTPVPIHDVSAVRYFPADAAMPAREWTEDEVSMALGFAAFEEPFVEPILPLGVTTGMLSIRYRRRGPAEERLFRIVNNRLLQDTIFKYTYYDANVDDLLASLRPAEDQAS